MSKIKKLVDNYSKHISIPWRSVAPDQRVMFCVYDQADERQLRFSIDLFEIETKKHGHHWALFDLTDLFAEWISSHKYAKRYYADPSYLGTILGQFPDYIKDRFCDYIKQLDDPANTVVALIGTGSLFGFAKVKDVVGLLAPELTGRLLVFFPGSYIENNYRLLDAYDGWNYLAIPITAE
jgi:hypothetical protein